MVQLYDMVVGERLRKQALFSRRSPETRDEDAMAWTTPTIVEVCAGFEVTAYASAEQRGPFPPHGAERTSRLPAVCPPLGRVSHWR